MENRNRFYASDNFILIAITVVLIILLYFLSLNYWNAEQELDNYTHSTECPQNINVTSLYAKSCTEIVKTIVVDSKFVAKKITSFRSGKVSVGCFLILTLPSLEIKEVNMLAFSNLESEKSQYYQEAKTFIDSFDTPFVCSNLHKNDNLDVEIWNNKIVLVYSLSPLGDKIAIPTNDYPDYVASKAKDNFYASLYVWLFVVVGFSLYLKVFIPTRRKRRNK